MFEEPAVGLVELKSIARGMKVADAMVKKAVVNLVKAHPICPGKYLIMIMGEVDPVREAMAEGVLIANDSLIAEITLAFAHPGIIPALTGTVQNLSCDAIAIVESFSASDAFKALDIALKKAAVRAIEIRLANGIGGKAYFVITGNLEDIQEAVATAREFLMERGQLVTVEIIPAPYPEFIQKGVLWTIGTVGR